MTTREHAGIVGGVLTLGGTLVSMINPSFIASTTDIWYPMVSYALRYGPPMPGVPTQAILTIATTMFVSTMAYRLWNKADEDNDD